MRILQPNTEEELVPIYKQHIYVSVTDFGLICFLKEIIVGPGQHSWEWIPLKADKSLDISGIDNKYRSFDYAINRAVSDLYCTIYEFKDFKEVVDKWEDIKYVDYIKTVFKS